MRTTYTCVLGLSLLCAPALAQPVHRPGLQVSPTQQGAEFESLFQVDEDGAPVGVDGPADLAAIDRNAYITSEQRAELKSAIDSWTHKLERLVVENIDLAVELDTNVLTGFDMTDQQKLLYIESARNMLNGAGSLTDYLYEKGELNDQQMQQNRRIVSDFQRGLMMYTGEQAQKDNPNDMDKQMEVVMRSNYLVALRDPFWVYNRIVESLAAHTDLIAEALPEAVRTAHADEIKALSAGNTDGVRALLSSLDYENQRKLAELAMRLEEKN